MAINFMATTVCILSEATHPHKYPLVFLHGIYQSSKTWESTPDGREGFQNIFIRHNFSTYNLTHPRRGNAGRGQTGINIQPIYDEQTWYTKWRIGIYPNYFKNVQFPHDQESIIIHAANNTGYRSNRL